jgi:hypothetical protein
MSKSKLDNSRKTTFGKRKGGRATKSLNKHNAKSAYHRRNASRN